MRNAYAYWSDYERDLIDAVLRSGILAPDLRRGINRTGKCAHILCICGVWFAGTGTNQVAWGRTPSTALEGLKLVREYDRTHHRRPEHAARDSWADSLLTARL